jgi:F0F1-type ATP synthase assembly protein I
MTNDWDRELEKMRAETRQRLDGEKELEAKLAEYKTPELPPENVLDRVKDEDDDDDEEDEKPAEKKAEGSLAANVAANAAAESAKKAAREVSTFSTPKLIAILVGLVFGAWIIDRLIGPIVTLVVLAILVLLGYRLLKWLTTPEKEDEKEEKDED